MNNKKIISHGISFGTALIFTKIDFLDINNNILKKNIRKEIEIFFLYTKKVLLLLNKMKNRLIFISNKIDIKDIEEQILILNDKKFIKKILFYIKKKFLNIKKALLKLISKYCNIYTQINKFSKYKLYNIQYVYFLLIKYLDLKCKINLFELNYDVIIIIEDLFLLNFININMSIIKGIIVKSNNINIYNLKSHLFEIPLILNFKNIYKFVKNNDFIYIDTTYKDIIYVNPSSIKISKIIKKKNNFIYK